MAYLPVSERECAWVFLTGTVIFVDTYKITTFVYGYLIILFSNGIRPRIYGSSLLISFVHDLTKIKRTLRKFPGFRTRIIYPKGVSILLSKFVLSQ